MRFSISSTGRSLLASERLQARDERRDVRGEQPGLEFLQELLHRQQGVDLRGVEPQAGELEYRPGLARRHETVASVFPVPFDRRVQAVAQV